MGDCGERSAGGGVLGDCREKCARVEVSAFVDASKRQVEDELRCPRCPAMNRPGAIVIEIEVHMWRAFSAVCAYEGPVPEFQPKESP
jgi:hypothetical protein